MRRMGIWIMNAHRQPMVLLRNPPVEPLSVLFSGEVQLTHSPNGPPNPAPMPKKQFAIPKAQFWSDMSVRIGLSELDEPWYKPRLLLLGARSQL